MRRLLSPLTLALFALTLFVSATLLFLVQPMIGKIVLPLLGGTPAVWNTCMVFFQAALLAGYAYAHLLTGGMGRRAQAVAHAGVLLLPLFFLPISVNADRLHAGNAANPVGPLLVALSVSAGLPFFVVSTSAPLLQRWFAGTAHPAGKDPYFLYAASNAGSLLALLAYPTVIEPHLSLASQTRFWTAGYVALALLTVGCAILSGRFPAAVQQGESTPEPRPEGTQLRWGARLHWVALAFVPSSLMLGTTTFLSTDIAAVPLLWVIPLALYLLSFVIAFARPPALLGRLLAWALPVGVLVALYLMLAQFRPTSEQLGATIGLHLAVLFVAALVCHGELAARRPPARHLTEFYLWMSFGGVLGGLVNALIAPQIFRTVAEYPLALLLACFLLPRPEAPAEDARRRWLDIAAPVAAGVLAACLLSREPALRFGLPLALCLLFLGRPLRFGLAVGAVLAVHALYAGSDPSRLHAERSFFGVLEVQRFGNAHRLVHGTTLHGVQEMAPGRRAEPRTYYHRQGPIGELFAARGRRGMLRRFAVVGLGVGTMAAYGGAGRSVTFYEIDPAVLRIARDARFFTYLRDCRDRGGEVAVVLGDARLRLEQAREPRYDVIVVDAFSSDAIPIHLMTREALRVYLARLSPDGVIAVHISNRYLDLEPVVGNLARDAGLIGRARKDESDVQLGKSASNWVALAREGSAGLGALARDADWKPLRVRPGAGVWTDDFSNVFGALR